VKRGFKAEAERISAEMRGELSLEPDEKLDALQLAEHLAIPVYTLRQAAKAAPNSVFPEYFSIVDPEVFSAVTVFQGPYQRLIVHNENHHPNRQASNLTHEISHSLLEHAPTAIVTSDGQRYWNTEFEQEANWLGAALLIPRDGALTMAKSGRTIAEIATRYGVSEILCRWRMGQSGVTQQIQRWRSYRYN
jgi:Zn-dependent peptidase ImmA (M78 family)